MFFTFPCLQWETHRVFPLLWFDCVPLLSIGSGAPQFWEILNRDGGQARKRGRFRAGGPSGGMRPSRGNRVPLLNIGCAHPRPTLGSCVCPAGIYPRHGESYWPRVDGRRLSRRSRTPVRSRRPAGAAGRLGTPPNPQTSAIIVARSPARPARPACGTTPRMRRRARSRPWRSVPEDRLTATQPLQDREPAATGSLIVGGAKKGCMRPLRRSTSAARARQHDAGQPARSLPSD